MGNATEKQTRKKLVAGNWKMNGSFDANEALILGFLAEVDEQVDVSVFCPFPYLSQVAKLLQDQRVAHGAQDVSSKASGAYTGEVSVAMLNEFAVTQVLVGHSERRQYHAESSITVAEKAVTAIAGGITPIVCVGETLAEREAGQVEAVIASQLDPVVEHCAKFVENGAWNLVIAYEPVWAIGTGKVASAQIAQDMHRAIRLQLAEFDEDVASHVGILYGGSVTKSNARDLLQQTDIDGLLVGGASLDPGHFVAICEQASELAEIDD